MKAFSKYKIKKHPRILKKEIIIQSKFIQRGLYFFFCCSKTKCEKRVSCKVEMKAEAVKKMGKRSDGIFIHRT